MSATAGVGLNETDYPQRQRGAFLRSKYAPQRNAEAYDYPDGIGKEKQGNRVVNGGLPPETELRNLSGSTPKVLHGIAVGSRGQVPPCGSEPRRPGLTSGGSDGVVFRRFVP